MYYIIYFYVVVYHYNPTSNRNVTQRLITKEMLYIIIILHQTATLTVGANTKESCISL